MDRARLYSRQRPLRGRWNWRGPLSRDTNATGPRNITLFQGLACGETRKTLQTLFRIDNTTASPSFSTSYSTKSQRRNSSQSRISWVWGQRAVPYSSSLATIQYLQGFANDVIDRSLHFLDPRDVVAMNE